MEYLARKINKAKWDNTSINYLKLEEIRADAVTLCTKTKEDSLSLWLCSLQEEDIKKVVLALASNMQEIDAIHLVLISTEELQNNEIAIDHSPGNTPFEDFNKNHRNVIHLNMSKLCRFASLIKTNLELQTEQKHRYFRMPQVRDILISAINNKTLTLEKLQPKVREKVAKELNNRSTQ